MEEEDGLPHLGCWSLVGVVEGMEGVEDEEGTAVNGLFLMLLVKIPSVSSKP